MNSVPLMKRLSNLWHFSGVNCRRVNVKHSCPRFLRHDYSFWGTTITYWKGSRDGTSIWPKRFHRFTAIREGHVYTMLCFHRYLYQLIYHGLSVTKVDNPPILLYRFLSQIWNFLICLSNFLRYWDILPELLPEHALTYLLSQQLTS